MTTESGPVSRFQGALRQASGLAGLMASRFRTPDSLGRIQAARLRRLAAAAVRDVPFHRERWRQAGLRPGDIRSLDDLKAIPIMTRPELRERPTEDIVSAAVDTGLWRTFLTSGTSGVPLSVHYRPEDEAVINLTWIRAYLACGLRPRDRLATFQGDGRQAPAPQRRWYGRFGLWRRKALSTWNEPETWLAELVEFRPDAVFTDARTYRLLIEAALESRLRVPSPRLLFNASVMIDPATRSRLEEVFGGRVFDFYGSFESGCLAWECPACGGYHVNSDTAIVEILKDGRDAAPGETGEVVVTNLFSTAMPFIRYALGDMVTKSVREPRCGWAFPLLASLEGRGDEILRFAGGRTIGPQPFHHIFAPELGVRHWRVVQDGPAQVSIGLEPEPLFDAAGRARLEAALANLFGPEVEIRWNIVDRLPAEAGFKRRAVINRWGGAGSRP